MTDWRDMTTAPRDGTVVELECTYGFTPWYGLHRWSGGHWLSPNGRSSTIATDQHLRWRPYDGAIADYVDPTVPWVTP